MDPEIQAEFADEENLSESSIPNNSPVKSSRKQNPTALKTIPVSQKKIPIIFSMNISKTNSNYSLVYFRCFTK